MITDEMVEAFGLSFFAVNPITNTERSKEDIRAALESAFAAMPKPEPVRWLLEEHLPSGSTQWTCFEHEHHCHVVGAKSEYATTVKPLYAAPPAPAVKALEWVEEDDREITAKTIFGHYVINHHYRMVELIHGYGGFMSINVVRITLGASASVADLKAEAWADYEARIMSAIDTPPKPPAPAVPEGWRDISTAPHSKQVLVFVPRADQPKNLPLGSWHIAYQTEPAPPLAQTWRYANGQFRGEQIGWPSHWMPLLAAPEAPRHDH